MYAVVKIGGRQYRVSEGDVLFVDRQNDEINKSITFDEVLMLNDEDGSVQIGAPHIEGAAIEATLLDQVKADKVIVFKKKRRKGYKKKNGHRQPLSQIKVETITNPAAESSEKKEKADETGSETENISTEMTAEEAVKHIHNTPLNELKGFVPDNEDRVTVQRAWDDKIKN
jgi:large subunit ribosomal protein L21